MILTDISKNAKQDKLESAVKEIDNADVRSRSIERKSRDIQELPVSDATTLLDDKTSI